MADIKKLTEKITLHQSTINILSKSIIDIKSKMDALPLGDENKPKPESNEKTTNERHKLKKQIDEFEASKQKLTKIIDKAKQEIDRLTKLIQAYEELIKRYQKLLGIIEKPVEPKPNSGAPASPNMV